MPGANLTRQEARERAGLVHVDSYQVELDLTGAPGGDATFRSTTTVRFRADQPGGSTFLDLVAPQLSEITLNGRTLDPSQVFDGARIILVDLAEHNEVHLVAQCAYMNTGEGLHRFTDPVDSETYLYSQFEVADARRMYACFEQPDLKGTFTFTVDAPAHWTLVSNSPTPVPEPLAGTTARWTFATTPLLATYVTTMIAGPYEGVRTEHRGIPLGVFARRSLVEHLDAEVILDLTRKGFDFFESTFGYPYPFAKYDQVFVPEFNAGAMENAAAVTILEDYVFRSRTPVAVYERRALTVLHELAHMWFGDLVTMRWWDDLWLNESFAEWASVLCQTQATEWTDAWTTFANSEKSWAYRQDQLPTTHPIAADIRDLEDVEVNFDGITYAKGASVLKQLVAWVGQDNFVAGLRRYFRAHEWSNSTLSDLLGELETTSGRDLGTWTTQWLQTAGVNTMRPEFTLDEAGAFSSFAIRQEAAAEQPTLRSHRLGVGLYDRTDRGLVRRDLVSLDVSGPRTEVAGLVGVRQPDLLLINDEDLTYTKVRLDERSLSTLVHSLGSLAEPLPRTLCWSAAWDMTRDQEMRARDYLELALANVGAETNGSVVLWTLRQARTSVDLYVAPAHREQAMLRLAEALDVLLRGAQPGSDAQLNFARAFAGSATTPRQLDLVAGLLDGSASLEGLSIDTDLRWTLLSRLVVTGHAGDDQIAAELRRDDTATGARKAAAARAMRPTPEAKAEAWAQVVDGDELPNAMQVAVISGFWQPEQRQLGRDYVDRYFTALREVWATRTNETAQNIVTGLFPSLLTGPEILEQADRWLGADDIPPALRRLVVESRDAMARALRVQEYDAQGGA
ncbi:MAG: aminopeptidase N [Actinomycetes bacterium]